MILYGLRASPFVRKILVLAEEKGIALEMKAAGMGQGGEEFAAASPFRKIPALVDGDYMLADSSAIAAYLDGLFPETPLIPAEPRARGKVMWFDEFADTIFVAMAGKIFFNRVVASMIGVAGNPDAADAAERDELPKIMDYLESVVPSEGFLVGDAFSLADIAVASPFVNLGYCSTAADAAMWPKTMAWVARITARPAFAKVLEIERKAMAGMKNRAY